MHNRRWVVSFLFAAVLSSSPGRAQTTWIVDGAGGSGSQFTTLSAAVAAAAAGDVILVRPGTYNETLDLDKGVAVFGTAAVHIVTSFLAPTVRIHDLPAGESAAVVGMTLGAPGSSSARIECQRCDGLVVIDSVGAAAPTGQGTPTLGMNATDCKQVQVVSVFFRGGIIFERSTAVVSGSILESTFASGALRMIDSDVAVDGATMSMRGILVLNAPVYLDGGSLRLARSSVSNNLLPAIANAQNGVAIYAAAGDVLVDPATTLNPVAGFPSTAGMATFETRSFETARLRWQANAFDLGYRGEPNAFFATTYSVPVGSIASPLGPIWVDPVNFLVFEVGQLDPAGLHSRTVPTTGIPAGVFIVVQPVFLTTAGITAGNANALVFR